ncbi:MAG: magnesium transporter CorA family protein [Deltaproteobacteria bacterium]
MLARHPSSAPTLADAVWIDLLVPSDEERQQVEQATKLRLPTPDSIQEIEHSSRAFVDGRALYLSTPVLQGTDCLNDALVPVGFVLSPERLVTLRFASIVAFDRAAAEGAPSEQAASSDGPHADRDPSEAFLKVLEVIVDLTADTLEHANAELERISTSAFRSERPRAHEPARASRTLHEALRKLGRMANGISRIRDTLLGVGRIVTFILDAGEQHRPATAVPRLEAIRADIASLNDYQHHLSGKIQFLLDATLGFINIQQNDIVKALTIVSVVGVPPVLIAGIYGMNFKRMPELSWALGYPYALALIVLSALLPILWFKWRDWL